MVCLPPPALTALKSFVDVDQVEEAKPLGNAGGFSGSKIWRVTISQTEWCLRRWPAEHPSPKQLSWIHQILHRAASKGVNVLPLARMTQDGRSFCSVDSHLWELTPWMPGVADYWMDPEDRKLEAALTRLADFHLAVRDVGSGTQLFPAPGVVARLKQLQRWRDVDPTELERGMRQVPDSPLVELGRSMLQLMPKLYQECEFGLESAARTEVQLQPCIRDIWHDHVLFRRGTLTGIVDFGAMRVDSVTCDVTRLLGSMVADDQRRWLMGMRAYQKRRMLTPDERSLLAIVDLANTILSGANWLRWLFLERRQFENVGAVEARMKRIHERLQFRVGGGFSAD